jgi:hypothetical protein
MLTRKTYADLASAYTGPDLVYDLPEQLIPLWSEDYLDAYRQAQLVLIDLRQSGTVFSYLFDLHLARIVASFGIPIVAGQSRDHARQRGYPIPGKGFVKGHLMAHALGGGLDINLIPQLGAMNNSRFKIIENLVHKEALRHHKCLYFVRALYNDNSQIPQLLEQCVLYPSKDLHYQLHLNS